MKAFLAVGLGGFCGAALRYYLGGWLQASSGGRFPIGILVVNVLGCFLIGALLGMGEASGLSKTARLFLVTGLLGALTTFSTFGWDTLALGREVNVWAAFGNIAANLLLGLAAVAIGIALSPHLLKFFPSSS